MAEPTGHTVKAFDADINNMRTLISQMGGLCESQIRASIEVLTRRDAAKAMEHGAAPETAVPQADFLRAAVNPEKSAFSEAAMWPWQMMQQMREQMQHTAEAAAQAAADAAAQASDDATPATKSRRSKK